MENLNRTFVFMIIVAIFFIVFNYFLLKTGKDNPIDQSNNIENNNNQNNTILKNNDNKLNNFEVINIKKTNIDQNDLIYENKNIRIEFNKKDGIIKHAYIKDTFLKETQSKIYDVVQNINNYDLKNGALQLKFGSWENDITLENLTNGNNEYNFERKGNNFIFDIEIKKKDEDLIYRIVKTYSFIDNENIFKLDISISNNKNIPTKFDDSNIAYSIGWGPNLSSGIHINKIYEFFEYYNGKETVKIFYDSDIIKKNNMFGKKVKGANDLWIARSDKYFTSIIYSDNQNYEYFFDYRDKENNNFYCGLSRVSNNSLLNSTFYIYIGPKIKSILKKYDNFINENNNFYIKDSRISKIVEPIMFGLGDIIGELLKIIYNFTKNYGIALIILTIIIKLILSPLTHQSMVSQEKIGKLQPKLKEIQEKYKDKPDLLNRETMNLYKKEGINPFGGCLPLLLQMPILLAMYQLIDRMIELKGANFLWINDLSLPDAIINFNFIIPLVNISSLNLLPIIMVITQILSSMLMPDVQSNQQTKMMIYLMPIIFFFLFYNVSSGLVLYWTIMNILNLIQQFFTMYLKKKIFNKNILSKT